MQKDRDASKKGTDLNDKNKTNFSLSLSSFFPSSTLLSSLLSQIGQQIWGKHKKQMYYQTSTPSFQQT